MDQTPSPQRFSPRGLIQIPLYAVAVTDPDEEIFLLYTRLASVKPADGSSTEPFRGLGYVDSKTDTLSVRLEISPPLLDVAASPVAKKSGNGRSLKARGKPKKVEPKVLEIELLQDGTALRSRKGDTGSVLWRASIEFAQLFLLQYHFPDSCTLFNPELLMKAHVVELGAGTGLLSVVLGPLVRRYTATDLPDLIPLIRKNISHISAKPSSSLTPHTIKAEALDWTLPADRQLSSSVLSDPPDLILVVDCIYHPSLVAPLIDTLTSLAVPHHTSVIVVAELRAEDVMTEFIQGWVSRDGWRVWNVGGEQTDGIMGPRYGVWVGWRENHSFEESEE